MKTYNITMHHRRRRDENGRCHQSLRPDDGERSKDQNRQTAHLERQACLWLIWPSDPGCVSCRTCGYRTRKPLLSLADRRQGALHCNGFRASSPMLQRGLRKRRGALGVVLGTAQYIVGRRSTYTRHERDTAHFSLCGNTKQHYNDLRSRGKQWDV